MESTGKYWIPIFNYLEADIDVCLTHPKYVKTATEIMSYLLQHTSESMDEKSVRKFIKKGAKAKSDEIIEAIKGYNIETDHAKKLELARAHLDYLDDMIT